MRTKTKADVYKFKVKLVELDDVIWRDIEITSVSSVAKLGYSILPAFRSIGKHMFNIIYKEQRYEIIYNKEDYSDVEPVINPIKTKLSALNLTVGDKRICNKVWSTLCPVTASKLIAANANAFAIANSFKQIPPSKCISPSKGLNR